MLELRYCVPVLYKPMDNRTNQGKQRFPDHFYNSITYFGVVLSVFILCCEFLLFGIDFFSPSPSVYLGLITYVLLPPFLIIGLILIPVGARWKHRRVLKGIAESRPKPIVIDLSLSTHQNAIVIFMVGTAIVLIMTAIGCYKAYNFTESQRFCGVTCHQVMRPEYTVYLRFTAFPGQVCGMPYWFRGRMVCALQNGRCQNAYKDHQWFLFKADTCTRRDLASGQRDL